MDSITSNLPAIVLVVAGLCLVAMLVMQALQISQLRQRLDMLTRGADGASLEGVLDAHLELVHQVSEDLDELTVRTAAMEGTARHHFAKIGLIRFNPFPDTGGNQSFALAMLDESDDGFIVSSLHSRTGTRIYAKPITAGAADATLSAEETEAIDQARARKTPPAAAAPARMVRVQAPVASAAAPETLAAAAESNSYGLTNGAAPAVARIEELDTEPLPAAAPSQAAPSSRFRLPLPRMLRQTAPEEVDDVAPPAYVSQDAGHVVAGEANLDTPAEAVSAVEPSGDTKSGKGAFKGQAKGETPGDDTESDADSERTGRRAARASESGPQS